MPERTFGFDQIDQGLVNYVSKPAKPDPPPFSVNKVLLEQVMPTCLQTFVAAFGQVELSSCHRDLITHKAFIAGLIKRQYNIKSSNKEEN